MNLSASDWVHVALGICIVAFMAVGACVGGVCTVREIRKKKTTLFPQCTSVKEYVMGTLAGIAGTVIIGGYSLIAEWDTQMAVYLILG